MPVFLFQETSVTALHIASKLGLIEIVRCLLLSGASPNRPNKDGVSPEIMALAEGFTSIAELLNKVKGVSCHYRRHLTLSTLGKIFSRQHFEIFYSYFSQKTGFVISRNGDNLHPVF